MITKKDINRIRNFINTDNNRQEINKVWIELLKDTLDTYNKANNDLKENGYIVESYKQKYVSPSYKIRTQSIKDINKILSLLLAANETDLENESAEEFINKLISE